LEKFLQKRVFLVKKLFKGFFSEIITVPHEKHERGTGFRDAAGRFGKHCNCAQSFVSAQGLRGVNSLITKRCYKFFQRRSRSLKTSLCMIRVRLLKAVGV